ncbi:hypothetical protein D3C80_2085800 [compost metagenome]
MAERGGGNRLVVAGEHADDCARKALAQLGAVLAGNGNTQAGKVVGRMPWLVAAFEHRQTVASIRQAENQAVGGRVGGMPAQ